MHWRRFALAYPMTALIFVALDACWLGAMADRLYRPALGALMLPQPELAPAVALYAIYVVGVVVFAVLPALRGRDWRIALGRGALLGLVVYATYDLTNQATLRGWAWHVSFADMAWGTVATAAASAISCALCLRIESGVRRRRQGR